MPGGLGTAWGLWRLRGGRTRLGSHRLRWQVPWGHPGAAALESISSALSHPHTRQEGPAACEDSRGAQTPSRRERERLAQPGLSSGGPCDSGKPKGPRSSLAGGRQCSLGTHQVPDWARHRASTSHLHLKRPRKKGPHGWKFSPRPVAFSKSKDPFILPLPGPRPARMPGTPSGAHTS